MNGCRSPFDPCKRKPPRLVGRGGWISYSVPWRTVTLHRRHENGADNGGLRYYVLDNEPSLWHETHRDIHAIQLSST